MSLAQASGLGKDSDAIKKIRAQCKWAFEDASAYYAIPSVKAEVQTQTAADGEAGSAAAPTDSAGVAEDADAT